MIPEDKEGEQSVSAKGAGWSGGMHVWKGVGISTRGTYGKGDKGCALRTVGKGVFKGPNPSLLDKRITDRRARIRKIRAIQCCILSSCG